MTPSGSVKYKVLSVGFDKNGVPLITIEEDGNPICYRLPEQLFGWAVNQVAIANIGKCQFPAEVVFINKEGCCVANISRPIN